MSGFKTFSSSFALPSNGRGKRQKALTLPQSASETAREAVMKRKKKKDMKAKVKTEGRRFKDCECVCYDQGKGPNVMIPISAQLTSSKSGDGSTDMDTRDTDMDVSDTQEKSESYSDLSLTDDEMELVRQYVADSGGDIDTLLTEVVPMSYSEMSGFSDWWERTQDKVMEKAQESGTKALTKVVESDKAQQAIYGIADKLLTNVLPSDPRAAEQRVKKYASTAAQAGGKALATQAKGELSELQKTIDKYLPYIKPVGFTLLGLTALGVSAFTVKAFMPAK